MADRYAPVKKQTTALVKETRKRVVLVGGMTGLLWGIEIVDWMLHFVGMSLDGFGVVPRTLTGLVGIAFGPFLHAGFVHLIANTLPFMLLGFLATSRKRMDFWVVFAISALTAGLGQWLLGAAGSVHLGASSVIFGFLGFLMGRGIWERRLGPIALSLGVTVAFGGMLWGLLPLMAGISWQGHLFGWIGGLITARLLGKALTDKRKR